MNDQRTGGALRLGPCLVDPESCSIERDGEKGKVTPRSMDVLLYLAQHADRIVSSDELLDTYWSPLASDHAVHKAIAELRSALGDSVRAQRFIKTIPKRGYKLLVVPGAVVEDRQGRSLTRLLERAAARLRYADHRALAGGLLALVSLWVLAVFAPRAEPVSEGRRTLIIAQYPFDVQIQDRDIAAPFADALYANLITRLTAVEALRIVPMGPFYPAPADPAGGVPPPTSVTDYQVRGTLVLADESASLYLNLVRSSSGIVAFSHRLEVTLSAAPASLDPLTDRLVDLITSRLLSADRDERPAARPRSSMLLPALSELLASRAAVPCTERPGGLTCPSNWLTVPGLR